MSYSPLRMQQLIPQSILCIVLPNTVHLPLNIGYRNRKPPCVIWQSFVSSSFSDCYKYLHWYWKLAVLIASTKMILLLFTSGLTTRVEKWSCGKRIQPCFHVQNRIFLLKMRWTKSEDKQSDRTKPTQYMIENMLIRGSVLLKCVWW